MQQDGHKAEQLISLSAVAQSQHNVVRRHHAEVAVIGIERVDKESRCSR